MIKFVVFYNGEPLKTYELDEPVVSIGRLPENTISIANMGVSRRHAKIEEDIDQKYILTDLNSLNGTLVNGKRIKKIHLSSGDKITIGKYTILYEELGLNNNNSIKQSSGIYQLEKLNQVHTNYNYGMAETKVPLSPQNTQPLPQSDSKEDNTGSVLIETNKHVVYRLDKDYMTVGSGENDDIFVSGFMIAEGQATIEKKDEGLFLCANKLIGKIKINGKSVRSHLLQNDDRIEIGSSSFRYMENG